MSFRIAILTSNTASHLVRATVRRLVQVVPGADIKIVKHCPPYAPRAVLKSQVQNFKMHGWRWLPYRVDFEWRSRRAALLRSRSPNKVRAPKPSGGTHWVSDINAPETVAMLAAWAPDLGLSIGPPLLKPALFNLPRLGTINLHQGRLPDYKGSPPAFWELWNGETDVGVSVHRIVAALDSGDVLATASVPIERYATLAGLRIRLDAVGAELMAETVARLAGGERFGVPQPPGGRIHRRGTLQQEALLRQRFADPRTPRTTAKSAFCTNYARLGTLLGRGRDSVVVLLYHRVSDEFRDTVTVGVERFDEHMAYIADHHRVVGLDDLMRGSMPAGDGPIVVVTFDDGYLDNYENAAPILERRGLTAKFFVSTRIVDERLAFQHDIDWYKAKIPTMSWAQVREMTAAGLTFGGHTATHVNMAQVDDATADTELSESKSMLAAKLGLEAPMFAYPFGKRSDFTEARLAQVKRHGYSANCSAYGGVNPLKVDIWDIRRQGIDHRFDVPALRARLAGWKSETYV